MIGRTNFKNYEHFERFHRSWRIITGERLPSWSLSFITKIILIKFATANDCPNLAHRLLMAFSDLERQNHKSFLQNNTMACAPTLSKNPKGSPQMQFCNFINLFSFTNYEHFEIFHWSWRIITGERLPSWSLSFITKIILIKSATANDCLNLAHRLWWLLVTLKGKIIKLFYKNNTMACAPTLRKIHYRASLDAILQFYQFIFFYH